MSDRKHYKAPKNENEPAKPSKSEVKRAMNDLQKIGESLVRLADSQLEQIPVPDNLLEAIKHAQSLKSHEAMRRQVQLIGKLMRQIDPEPIRSALKQLQFSQKKEVESFHELERWREELITQGDEALQRFCESYPEVDRQALRQVIRKAQHDRKVNKNSGGERALFHFLKDLETFK